MIKAIFGYSSGVRWFDYAADICVGVIVVTVVAFAAWWLHGHLHYGSD